MAINELAVAAAPRPLALPPGLGAAAERFAPTTLRKSAQTQRTYASTYARFTAWLAAYTELADPPLQDVAIDVIRELAGHADIRTTTIDTAVHDDRLKDAINDAAQRRRGLAKRAG